MAKKHDRTFYSISHHSADGMISRTWSRSLDGLDSKLSGGWSLFPEAVRYEVLEHQMEHAGIDELVAILNNKFSPPGGFMFGMNRPEKS